MKVALVHDWILGYRGGEKCLDFFLSIYPEADIYTLFHRNGTTTDRIDKNVKATSFLNKLPVVHKYYRTTLPLFPKAISRFNFNEYDLVISLSHAAAKNISVSPGVKHVCFCFTPMRYIWDQATAYLGFLTTILWPEISRLRLWDKKGSDGVTEFIAISKFISARIRKYYGRDSTVIYPPVDCSWIKPPQNYSRGEAFLCAGALVPYKKIDVAIQAFNQSGEKLWIVGDGPERFKLQKIAKTNISFLGRVTDADLAELYAKSKALIFPGTEDFGFMPIEAMAAGRPVICPFSGGCKETVRGVKYWKANAADIARNATGVFYKRGSQDHIELKNAINFFHENENSFSVDNCVQQASLFKPDKFRENWDNFIKSRILS